MSGPRAFRPWRVDPLRGPAWSRAPASARSAWRAPLLLLAVAALVTTIAGRAPARRYDAHEERVATEARRAELVQARGRLLAQAHAATLDRGAEQRARVRDIVVVHRLHGEGRLRELAAAEVELRAAALELDALTRVSTSTGGDVAWKRVRARLEDLDLQERAPHVR